MRLAELTEFLVKNLVRDPESVSVKQFEDDDFINIEVLVSEDEMGTVICRKGINAKVIRTIVYASAYANKEKRVKINIDSL